MHPLILRHVKTFAPLVETSRLYAYPDPVSPHIATTEVKIMGGYSQMLGTCRSFRFFYSFIFGGRKERGLILYCTVPEILG